MLVAASMIVFRDPVSPLQGFGYSIALGGLIYYKLGAEKLKEYIAGGGRAWADYGVRHPAARKMIIFTGALLFLFLLLGGVAPHVGAGYGYDPSKYVNGKLDQLLGKEGEVPN